MDYTHLKQIILPNIRTISEFLGDQLDKIQKYENESNTKMAAKTRKALILSLDNLIASANIMKSKLEKG